MFNNSLSHLVKIAVLGSLFTFNAAHAGQIDYYSGIEIEGEITGTGYQESLFTYEANLSGFNALNSIYGQTLVKLEQTITNITSENFRGRDVITGGDIKISSALGFDSQTTQNTFDNKLANKDFVHTTTNVIIAPHPVQRNFNLSLEDEVSQQRTNDQGFYDSLFDSTKYSDYYLELSFNFQTDASADPLTMTSALTDALDSYYIYGNNLSSLVAVELESFYDTDFGNSNNVNGSISRKLWFNSEQAANDAKTFFDNDIVDREPGDSFHNGYLQHVMLNSNHPIYRDFLFSNVSNSVQKAQVTSVPEPSTLAIFALSILGFASRIKRK